jgi:hypothetical protein
MVGRLIICWVRDDEEYMLEVGYGMLRMEVRLLG